MSEPLPKHNDWYCQQQDQNVDTSLSAKGVHITRLGDPRYDAVKEAEGDYVLQAVDEFESVSVDGEVAVADVSHCCCRDEGQADGDETISKESK